jgi:hypothetical protein
MPASISFIRASRNERQWSVLGPARHIKFTTKTYMASPSWFSVVVRTLISPCSGRDFERLTSRTSLPRRLSSPGRTGRGWRNSSKPAPTMPPAGLGSVSTKSRVVTAMFERLFRGSLTFMHSGDTVALKQDPEHKPVRDQEQWNDESRNEVRGC